MLGLKQSLSIGKKRNASAAASLTNEYSIDFDGTDDYVNVDDACDVIDTEIGSFSGWGKLETVAASVSLFRAKTGTGDFYRVWWRRGLGQVRFQLKRGGVNYEAIKAISIENDGQWHHWAMTWDRTSQELIGYFDGDAIAAATTLLGTLSGTLSVAGIAGYQYYWKGNIDEVALWDSVLTADEITAIYNSGTPTDLTVDAGDYASSSDLVGYWRMEENTGTTVADSSSNSNTGTLTNGAAWSSTTP